MWAISTLTNPNGQAVSMSDGLPINAVRGPEGVSFRMIATRLGFLDFTDMGHQPGGPHWWQIVISGEIYLVLGDAEERRLGPGDTVVQRGAPHAWENRSDEPCVMSAVMMTAR